jgi:hypothetical protein
MGSARFALIDSGVIKKGAALDACAPGSWPLHENSEHPARWEGGLSSAWNSLFEEFPRVDAWDGFLLELALTCETHELSLKSAVSCIETLFYVL